MLQDERPGVEERSPRRIPVLSHWGLLGVMQHQVTCQQICGYLVGLIEGETHHPTPMLGDTWPTSSSASTFI
jgi:hypothetical protein